MFVGPVRIPVPKMLSPSSNANSVTFASWPCRRGPTRIADSYFPNRAREAHLPEQGLLGRRKLIQIGLVWRIDASLSRNRQGTSTFLTSGYSVPSYKTLSFET